MSFVEITRVRLQELTLKKAGLSREGLQIFHNHKSIAIQTRNNLEAKGFSNEDIDILMNKWGDHRVSLSAYRPKKTKIIQAINSGENVSAISRRFNVTTSYVRQLQQLVGK